MKSPSPVQLAKIAAGFGSAVPPEEAIRRASELYRHAQQPPTPSAKAGVLAALQKIAKPCLILKPDRSSDEVRHYLQKNGLPLAKARSVIDNLVEFMAVREAWKFLNRRNICIPNAENLTQSEWDTAVTSLAEKHLDGETKRKYQSWLRQGFFSPKKDAYEIPQPWLDGLIRWKKRRKSTGGKRSAAKASKGTPPARSASGKFLAKKT